MVVTGNVLRRPIRRSEGSPKGNSMKISVLSGYNHLKNHFVDMLLFRYRYALNKTLPIIVIYIVVSDTV
jgi:hypothetical protein